MTSAFTFSCSLPTGVEGAVWAQLEPEGPPALAVASNTLLSVYLLAEDKLDLWKEYPLQGSISDMAKIRFSEDTYDSLILSFKEAKV